MIMKTAEFSEVNEEIITKYEERVCGKGNMPLHNKATMRRMLEEEDRAEQKRQGREEEGHSNSAVGDRFNMRTY